MFYLESRLAEAHQLIENVSVDHSGRALNLWHEIQRVMAVLEKVLYKSKCYFFSPKSYTFYLLMYNVHVGIGIILYYKFCDIFVFLKLLQINFCHIATSTNNIVSHTLLATLGFNFNEGMHVLQFAIIIFAIGILKVIAFIRK